MNLLIVASTQHEIAPILNDNQLRKKFDVLISGVGIPSTIFHLTKKLHHHHYDLVIQAGIAGSAADDLEAGTTVLVKKDAFADIGAFENGGFKSLTDMDLSHELEWQVNPNEQLLARFDLRKVKAVTINSVTDNSQMLQAVRDKWNGPEIETMEGAALHYVCNHLHKPYLQLRSISNKVGVRDKSQWNMDLAINKLNESLAEIVKYQTGH